MTDDKPAESIAEYQDVFRQSCLIVGRHEDRSMALNPASSAAFPRRSSIDPLFET
jgi:hypothetical protein